MLSTSASIALGLVFVIVGGTNVWLILESWSRVKSAHASSRMVALHRIGGYLFIALFLVMTYFMAARLRAGGAEMSPTATIHLVLALILSPLLFIKVLIARYYKGQHGLLLPIGLTIFVLAFVLIATTAGPYLLRSTDIERVSLDPGNAPPVAIDMKEAAAVMQKQCSRCHTLDRVVGARKDLEGWVATVDRMRAMPSAGISAADARLIVSFLASEARPQGSAADAKMAVGRALVDQRCGRCHSLDRVYKATETPAEWREIVARMTAYASGSAGALRPGEDQRILEYLAATQTPAAVAQRKARAEAAASSGESLIAPATAAASALPAPAPRSDWKMLGFVSFVCLAAVALVVRRPGARTAAPAARSAGPSPAAPGPPRSPTAPFVLRLAQITGQTHDAKTLRFAVHGGRQLDARPGQFLTFAFLFDGKKETRCYSICSSPARSGYVEITPKRVNGGCVSVFLNERAPVGMTVEATGPFGQFYLDPAEKKIALLAAGSGITPMMAMLRYVDDLCLDIDAALFYAVRTSRDIIFQQELDDLEKRLPNFRYHVLVSQPDPQWQGARGHIHREFISNALPEGNDRVFFLCGPPPFMTAARAILAELGVPGERIRQETFGGGTPGAQPGEARASETGLTLEFARSGTSMTLLEGQTLLEAAARSGIEIPSACRQGQCGTCKTKLLDGQVRMAAEQGLDAESKGRGFVLACVAHAETNVKLDV